MAYRSDLITGANGAIGRVLVRAFVSHGWLIVATDPGDTGPIEDFHCL